MAIQNINVGTVANDGTGDDLRTAFGKLNSNFSDSGNAASKLVATIPQALAGTPGVIPDAAGVKSYVDQFGIGTSYAVDVDTDMNSAIVGGLYRFNGDELNTTGLYGTLLVIGYDAIHTTQVTFQYNNDNTYVRRQIAGTWLPWRLQYNQANIVGTVSQSGGIPTGAIIETGSNANGVYTKFADGTLICRNTVATASIGCTIPDAVGFVSPTQTWTYPTAFTTVDSYQITGMGTPALFTISVGPTSVQYVWYTASSSAAATRYAGLLIIGRWY